MKRYKSLVLICFLALAIIVPSFADEGMWLFNMAPFNLIKTKYKVALTQEWLDHLRLASLKAPGGSASFVSAEGLVLTNHHIGATAIQNLSTKERDLMKTGFHARTRNEELKCPGTEYQVLQAIEDVTSRVQAAEKPGMSAAEIAAAREKAVATIEKEAADKTGLRCQVVTLYAGALYHLYQYKVYTDVRLVFAPEYAIAFFGGDPDNFTYPRYDLDFSLFRIYESGQPLKTPHYLKWNDTGVREGELVFVSGHPGSTGRLLTYAQLEFLRDVSYPFTIANYQRRRALLQNYGKRSAEEARIALRTLFGIENSLKATIGYNWGLVDKTMMAKKLKEEQDFHDAVMKNPALASEFGLAWDEIAAAQKVYAAIFKPLTFFERSQGFNSIYFTTARNLVRLAAEKTKPNEARLREYRDSNLAALERNILSPEPIYDDFEVIKLADSLAQLKEELGDAPETKWICGARNTQDVAKELIAGTKLKNIDIRKKYLKGLVEDIYQSDDAMIKLALLVDPVSRGIRARFEKEVSSVESKNGALIARAMFKLKGLTVPPDATSSLRLSFGPVKSYLENGKKIPIQTTFAGFYEKAEKNGYKDPYELPQRYLDKKKGVRLSVPVNFISTADSIGGNSGSPVVNVKGELVGVLFDGNIQSLPNRFVYTDELARSVMVQSRGIIEALVKIYDAKPLADELLGKNK